MSPARAGLGTLGLTVVSVCVALAQPVASSAATPAASTASSPKTAPGAVATVGTRRVDREDFERQSRQAVSEFERQRSTTAGDEIQRLMRRQVLERMIRENLLVLEARRRKIPVTDAEVEAEFHNHPFFNPGGTFDARRFEQAKAANSPEYRATAAEIRDRIMGRKLAGQLATEFAPDPSKLKADAERALSRADVEVLALRATEINGEHTEPREEEILAYYRDHARDYQRTQRATLSTITIGRLPGVDSDAHARATADSVLARIRAGAAFDATGSAVGDVRTGIRVTPSGFPSTWRGDAATNASVFRQTPGGLLPAPVPGTEGWLVVRVDAVQPAGVATLGEVAPEIRGILRAERKRGASEPELRALYESRKSMLQGTGYKARYASVDTQSVKPGSPTSAELDRYYRAHLADYSVYDPASGGVRTRPLEEVRDDVRARWTSDRRLDLSRDIATRLRDTWQRGKRDRGLEGQTSGVHEGGPLSLGSAVDDTPAGRLVGDSLAARNGAMGSGMMPFGSGFLVFSVYEQVRNHVPSFEDYRPSAEAELEARQERLDEEAARKEFEHDPGRYAGGRVVYVSDLTIDLLDPARVPLTRKEVERYRLSHMDRYSAPEQIRCRHILVSPADASPTADAAAREKAEDLLRRVRSGEDIAELARQYSDDPPTRKNGGDLGFFGRGVMLDAFEQAAFALKVGEVSGVVRTEAGYHIIKMIDRLPMQADPLPMVYTNVGNDAARDKAIQIAHARADSVLRLATTPAQARAIARKLGVEIGQRQVRPSDLDRMLADMRRFWEDVTSLPPGTLYPRVRDFKGTGTSILWVDSVGTDTKPSWEEARDRVLDDHRSAAGRKALLAKRAELDSLESHGWTLDSLATLWGGFERAPAVAPGKGLPGLHGATVVDSLVFGGGRPPALGIGDVSGWCDIETNFVRVRLLGRQGPNRDALGARIDSERRYRIEHQLEKYFADLEQRYPVRILDSDMQAIDLPPVPAPSTR